MLVKITKASDHRYQEEKEIKTLDDLLNIMIEHKHDIVLVFKDLDYHHYDHIYQNIEVIIYDYYLE